MKSSLLLMVLFAALGLAACGGNAEQSVQTERYTVTFRLEGSGTGERRALIGVTDREGRPVAVQAVVVAPVMRDMGMASPEATATPEGSGRYVAQGAFFSMLGAWEIDVRISADGRDDLATFRVQVE
jgi:hypothetical protein